MLEFQRMQGDARDYQYAYSGGDGTTSGPEPGELLVDQGTCRQELWPDDRPTPVQDEKQLVADAQRYRLDAIPWPIGIDDVKKVLSAGCPGACFHQHRHCIFRRRTRWTLQRCRTALRPPRPPRHADRRLYREFLYNQKFLGNGLGRPRILLRSQERPDRLRSGIRRSANQEDVAAAHSWRAYAHPIRMMLAEVAHAGSYRRSACPGPAAACDCHPPPGSTPR